MWLTGLFFYPFFFLLLVVLLLFFLLLHANLAERCLGTVTDLP